MSSTGEIFKALVQVQRDLVASGIKKERTTDSGPRYSYRGIDDIYEVVGNIMSKAGIVCVPTKTNTHYEERVIETHQKTSHVRLAAVTQTYRFYAEDGSFIEAEICGEGVDHSDKATNKALSAAYKYLMFQTFCIPYEGNGGATDSESDNIPVGKPANRQPNATGAASGSNGANGSSGGQNGSQTASAGLDWWPAKVDAKAVPGLCDRIKDLDQDEQLRVVAGTLVKAFAAKTISKPSGRKIALAVLGRRGDIVPESRFASFADMVAHLEKIELLSHDEAVPIIEATRARLSL